MLDEPFTSSVKKLKKQRAAEKKDAIGSKSTDCKIQIGGQDENEVFQKTNALKNQKKNQKKTDRLQLWALSTNLKMEVYKDEQKWLKFKKEEGITRTFDDSESVNDSCEDKVLKNSDGRAMDQIDSERTTKLSEEEMDWAIDLDRPFESRRSFDQTDGGSIKPMPKSTPTKLKDVPEKEIPFLMNNTTDTNHIKPDHDFIAIRVQPSGKSNIESSSKCLNIPQNPDVTLVPLTSEKHLIGDHEDHSQLSRQNAVISDHLNNNDNEESLKNN
eukprot:TCONS_00061122-protein